MLELAELRATKEAALAYAERGWPVLPLRGKRPATQHGVHDASTNTEVIIKRFAKNPNVGIQTGQASGLVVIDIDPRNGGDATLDELIECYGPLPETLTAETGGGGFHLVYRYPGGRLKGKLGAGIDVKSNGGYIVAPPSVHPDTGKPYIWRQRGNIVPMPDWMLEILQTPISPVLADSSIHQGERNTVLLEVAGRLKRQGISSFQLETKMHEENLLRCNPPLPDDEVSALANKISSMADGRSFKTQWQESVMEDTELRMYQRGVLMALSFHMNVDGKNCYPAMATLASRVGTTRKALSKALEAGISRGWLRRYRRPKPKGTPGKQKWSYGYVATLRSDDVSD